MTSRAIRLPDRFYLPRTDPDGREVRDVMPWEGAVSYATDGERLGIQYGDGRVVWLGNAPGMDGAAGDEEQPDTAPAPPSFEDDFEGVNLDALVDGLRSYVDMHPVLRTVWREDLATLEDLRHKHHDDES
ncbi:hypothetical protein [Longimicrobium sp.]|uniref:hypothetical protein n=1 Tax=Longimicrobium sp. TaxID=2029185 RepID=UPI002D7EFD19|nr:hypothetical protein [Longimicrobium sp.]